MADEAPLKLRLDPGTYRCTWSLPVAGEEDRALPGDVELAAGEQPSGTMQGDVPVVWQVNPGGGSSAGFPQRIEVPVLTGRLANGLSLLLVDAVVTMWMHDQAVVDARAAVVAGVDLVPADGAFFSRMKLQLSHLDSLMGEGPISSTTHPADSAKHLDGTWSVSGNPASSQAWQADGVEVRLEFEASVTFGDRFRFRMSFSPVIVVSVTGPTPFEDGSPTGSDRYAVS